MKSTIAAIVASCVLSVVASVTIVLTVFEPTGHGDCERAAAAEARLAGELATLRETASTLNATVGELGGRVRDLAASLETRTAGALPDESSDAAVVPTALTATPEAVVADEDERRARLLDEAIEEIFDPSTSSGRRQAAWTRLAKAGLLDDAIALFEERATEHPDDPDAQADLGHAYIQKIFTVSDIEKMTWSSKANAQYDKALALNESHWEARFSKAVNFSFAPPVFGLQNRAVEQFEILRQQQESQPVQESKFAETYVLLGNLYDTQGKTEQAKATWRRGLELFPDNGDLAAKSAQ